MVRRLKFYKEESGEWYVDLPEWEGEKADLQMVAGADLMLDILSQFEDSIWLTMADELAPELKDIPVKCKLERNHEANKQMNDYGIDSGSIYSVDYQVELSPMDIWLCDVTKFVFGDFPETIYLY